MTDLLLHEREQLAVRAVIAAEQVPGVGLPGEGAVALLGRVIPYDAAGVALLDVTGSVVDRRDLRGHTAPRELPTAVGPLVGIQRRDLAGDREAGPPRGLAVLSLGVRNGTRHVVALWMVRRTRNFSEREHDLLALVAPALERLMRQRITSATAPALTVQEHRVLRQVASGLSNAEVAVQLCIAPCTVRKHLENAYRKLGVSNRMAAVLAIEGRRTG